MSIETRTWGWAAAILATATIACGSAAPADGMQTATGVTATWSQALNANDATALSALYTDRARVIPPGGPALIGRTEIASYWKTDIGAGGTTTTVTPIAATEQGDLLHVEGTYEAKGKDGATLARGQYEQLWERTGGTWGVRHEFWRIDPAADANTDLAGRLSSTWTRAYNGGDAKALAALYANDAMLSSVQDGTFAGRDSIQSFWTGDLGGSPTSTLTLSDAYVAGDLAHLEGEYKVEEKGRPVTTGRYTQLWMREGSDWRIHRELWWR